MPANAPTPRARARRAVGSFGLMDRERHPHDAYETPDEAVAMLLRFESFADGIWDSSAGRGRLVKALAANLRPRPYICATDLHNYTVDHDFVRATDHSRSGVDFLATTAMEPHTRHIVINPPYRESEHHVRHALSLLPDRGAKLAVLLRLTWIAAKRRADLLAHLRKIIICGRCKMLPPDVPDEGHGGTVDFAWMIFGPHEVSEGVKIIRA